MKAEVMSHANLAIWPTITLVIFFTLAIAVGIWVFRRGSKQKYEQMGRLVLDQNETTQEEKHV